MAKPLHRTHVREIRRDHPDVISIDMEPCGMPAPTTVDDHVKIVLPPPGASWHTPVPDPLPDDQAAPLLRTYTRRRVRPDGGWGIDVLLFDHGGPGNVWARGLQVGDAVDVRGPGGHFPMPRDPGTIWMVGDDVALPTIANALAELPSTSRAVVVVEEGHHDYPLPDHPGSEVVRVPVSPGGLALVEAVADLPDPTGTWWAFVHGQAAMVRPLRRHLRVERGLDRDRLALSAYWIAGRDAEAWRAMKSEFTRTMEAESGD